MVTNGGGSGAPILTVRSQIQILRIKMDIREKME